MTDHTTPSPEAAPRRRLRRSADDRVLAGVSGGIAEHLSVDPVLVRLAFVGLAAFGGGGILVYAVAWLLVPLEGTGERGALAGRRNALRAAVRALAILVVAGIAFGAGVLLGGFGGAAAVAVSLVLVGLALLVAGLRSAEGARVARYAALPAIALAVGAAVPVGADVDLRGGFGERTVRPTSAAGIPGHLEAGAGRLTLDLRDVQLRRGRTDVRIDLGAGDVRILLPESDACAAVTASVGAGAVQWFGSVEGGFDVRRADPVPRDPDARVLVIGGHLGAGRLMVDNRAVALDDDHDLRVGTPPACG